MSLARRRTAALPGGRRRAFALIELLVVMAIIAAMVALVIPVFGRSMSLVRRAGCAGNLRALSTSFAMFQNSEKMRADKVQGEIGGSWAGFIFPYLAFHVGPLKCPEADAKNHLSPPRFTKRYWGNIEWDFFNMDNSTGPFAGEPAPWDSSAYADFYNQGSVPTMWKLNEEDYRTWLNNSSVGWGVMHTNKNWLRQYTPGSDPDRYWIVFEDGGGVWASANGGGHDYRDYAVHVHERGPNTYDLSFYEFGSSDANHGVVADSGLEMWIEEGSGDAKGVGPFYFSDPPTNYGKNSYTPRRGGRQVLLLDYETILCQPDAEPDSDEAFEKNVAPRHLNRCNVLFADGGVEPLYTEQFTPRNSRNYDEYWKPSP